MLRAEKEEKAELMKPTLVTESFVDSSGAPLKDGEKVKADLKQEENNVTFREDL